MPGYIKAGRVCGWAADLQTNTQQLKHIKRPFAPLFVLSSLHHLLCVWSLAVDDCQQLTTQITAGKLGAGEKTQLDFLMGLSHEWLWADFYFLVRGLKIEPLDCSTLATQLLNHKRQKVMMHLFFKGHSTLHYMVVVEVVRGQASVNSWCLETEYPERLYPERCCSVDTDWIGLNWIVQIHPETLVTQLSGVWSASLCSSDGCHISHIASHHTCRKMK